MPNLSTSDDITLLCALVRAHEQRHRRTGAREAIIFFRAAGGSMLQHFAFEGEPPPVDETALEDLRDRGLVDIDYLQRSWRITPSLEGRTLVRQFELAQAEKSIADTTTLVDALKEQREADNRLAWPAVRPVLVALRQYWEQGGFPADGFGTLPLLLAAPDGTEGMFSATVRTLVAAGYLEERSAIAFNDLPAIVSITERTFTVVDGWPGASAEELLENLVAVLAERAAAEEDPERRKRFERVGETIRELGVSTASEVLAKVLMGG
jgi:hypothetical protein